jgi:hypothetical protein
MIITEATSSPVITSIASTPSRFKIKASAKAFKILSGFYSEPILAIPRELGANAWDSHVKAGNTGRMFEVHAPNTLEPWFSVRDFGTGLSAAHVDTIYTTYFESTKTSDNDSDGCMGLGSKTPFNYTDNFTVTSWFGGKKDVYSCFIDESGSPNIMHVRSSESTEHTGLEVKFGVKISDISMFVDKITRAFEPFHNRPIIKGANIAYPERVYSFKGKTWGQRKSQGTTYNTGGCNAIMGNYCYPISTAAIRNALYHSGKSEKLMNNLERTLQYGSIDLFFNIGDLDVAPNKEQLQYDDNNKTVVKIISAITVAYEELKVAVHANVEIPATRWEAMAIFYKYNSNHSDFRNVQYIVGEVDVIFDGKRIDGRGQSVTYVHGESKCRDSAGFVAPYKFFTIDEVNGKHTIRKSQTYYPSENLSKEYIFFYTGKESVKNSRILHYISTKYTADTMPICFVVSDLSPNFATLNAHKKYFGWKDTWMVNADTLPKAPSKPREKRETITDSVITYSPTNQSSRRVKATIDSTQTYYYINLTRESPGLWNGKNTDDVFFRVLKTFSDEKLGGNVDVVYGINKTNSRFLKRGTWINVFDAVNEHVQKNKTKYASDLFYMSMFDDLYAVTSVFNKLTRSSYVVPNIKNPNTKAMFTTFCKIYTRVVKDPNDHRDFYKFFNIISEKPKGFDFSVSEFNKTLEEKYMNIFDLAGEYNDLRCMADIINFIDEKS